VRRVEIEITKRVDFSASHQLYCPDLSPDENAELYGKCVRHHGHNYVLEATVSGVPDARHGMVMNLRELGQLVRDEIIAHVDHRHLNCDVSFLDGVIPTSENMVQVFWDRLDARLQELGGPRLRRLRLFETPTSWAEMSRAEAAGEGSAEPQAG